MSSTQQKQQNATPADPPATNENAPNLTVTKYQQMADAVMASLDELVGAVPGFEAKQQVARRFVRSHVNVPGEFIKSAISAVAQIPALQGTKKLDHEKATETLQFIDAFTPVYERLNAISRSMRFVLLSEKAGIGAPSRQIYKLTKALSVDGDEEALAHTETMRRNLGLAGRRKAKKDGKGQQPQNGGSAPTQPEIQQ